jgi:uncharacterized protein YbjQ (UPF0145 family)
VPNITNTSNDLGSTALEVWGTTDGILQNVGGGTENYVEGTLLTRNPVNGNLVPYSPAVGADRVVDVTVDVASVTNATGPDQAVVVAGALIGDLVQIEPLGVWPVGLSAPQGRVLVDGTVQVRVVNVTGAPVDPVSQTFRFFLAHNANVLGPKYVLTYPVTLAPGGTQSVTVLAAGKVNQRRLFVHGAPPVAATADQLDALLNRPIIPVDINQLAG